MGYIINDGFKKIKANWIKYISNNPELILFGNKNGVHIQNGTNGPVRILNFTKDGRYTAIKILNEDRTDINTVVIKDNCPGDTDYTKEGRFEVVCCLSYLINKVFPYGWLYADNTIFISTSRGIICIDDPSVYHEKGLWDLVFPNEL